MKNGNNDEKNNFTDFNLIDTKEITSVLGMKRLNTDDIYFDYIIKGIIEKRNLPSMFFVSSKQESLNIYLKAKKMKRRILYISPFMIPFKNKDLKDNYSCIEQYLNYKSCVLNNYVVIVDIDYMADKNKSKIFMHSILNIVEKTLAEMDNTIFNENIIVFDDSYLYSTCIRDLLYRSKTYNTGLTFMIKQINGAFEELELRCLFEESINKVLLPSIYSKDRNELLTFYDVRDESKVYLIKNNSLNIIDELESVSLNNSESISDKSYKSMLKVFNNKISKFEKSINKDLDIVNNDDNSEYNYQLNHKSNIINNVPFSVNDTVSNKSKYVAVDNSNNRVADNFINDRCDAIRSSETSIKPTNNNDNISSSLAEKLKISLQGYNSNREELDLSFDDDDFIE